MAEIQSKIVYEDIKPLTLPELQPAITQAALTEIQPAGSSGTQPKQPEQPAQSSAEKVNYKSRIQEYCQRSSIPFPSYQTFNEGTQHAPKFRATVTVDGSKFTSTNVFQLRKVAEQDVARVACEALPQKIKEEGCPLICEDPMLCKSILHEYAAKSKLEIPSYISSQPNPPIPLFVSTLVFNGVTYTGPPRASKREAEQFAARSVILTILDDLKTATVISEVIKSKCSRVKDLSNRLNEIVGAVAGVSTGPLTANVSPTKITQSIPEPAPLPLPNVTGTKRPLHELKSPKPESTSESIDHLTAFMPPALQPPLLLGSASAGKKRRRNKKAKKTLPENAQLGVGLLPPNQGPSCSVAQ